MRKLKYFIPVILLSFYLLLSNDLVFANSIEDDFIYNDNSTAIVPEMYYPGGVTIYGDLNINRKDLVIPDMLGGKLVTNIWYEVFNNKGLTSLSMPNNVKLIGYNAFYNNQLSSVSLSNQLEWIGDFAFGNNQLSSITIPNSVKRIGQSAFIGNDLKTITIESSNTLLLNNAIPKNTKILGVIPSKAKEYADANGNLFEVITQNKITYDGNGQTSGEVLEDFTGKMTGTFFVKDQGSLKRTEYTFVGWNSNRDGSGTDYNVGEEKLINQDLTLYAQWEKSKYLVSYETDGGTILLDITVAHNQTITKPTGVTKQGHSLEGWYTDTNLTMKYDFTTPVTSNLTLYAKWDVDQYTVSYETDGGTTLSDITVAHNQTITKPTGVTKQGHSLEGWYTDTNLTMKYDFTTPVTSNLTLYAKWVANSYTVTFNVTGGTTLAPKTILFNEKVMMPPVPTKVGYTFAGWYKEATYTTEWNFLTDVVTGNITLYAKWTVNTITWTPPASTNNNSNNPIPTMKITFHTNGGTEIEPIDIAYNTKISDLPVPTRKGFRFVGWYEDVELTKPWVEGTVIRENISLYTKWIEITEDLPKIPNSKISDIDGHWAQAAIEELIELGIIRGYEDGTFRPNESISRKHVAALLTRTFPLEAVRGTVDFQDVPLTHSDYDAIQILQRAGIIDGSNGKFLPEEKMTRAQLAKVLVMLMGITPEGVSSFSDVDSHHWSANYIAVLEREGITLGDNGKFHPNTPVTRAQFVTFLYRIMQKNNV